MNWYLSKKLFSVKSINPIQNYPHIIELYAYILKIFLMIFCLFLINFLISLEICSTSKLTKYVTLLPFTYNTIQ